MASFLYLFQLIIKSNLVGVLDAHRKEALVDIGPQVVLPQKTLRGCCLHLLGDSDGGEGAKGGTEGQVRLAAQ